MNTRTYTTEMLNDPYFIGFDSLFNKLNRSMPTKSNNYPPYNVIKTGEDSFTVELAVAGFTEEEIDIEVADGVLTIKGEVETTEDDTTYIHRGIAKRAFERKFTLADTIVVDGAELKQGLLAVNLMNVIPDEKKPRKIPIGKAELLLEE